jgi:hypothetical protein
MSDAPDWTKGYQGRLEPNFEAKVMSYDGEDENDIAGSATDSSRGALVKVANV